MRKTVLAVTAIGILILAAGAGAASRWVITSTHQIKPSVLRELKGKRGPQGATGPRGATGPGGAAAPAGVGTTTLVGSPEVTLQPGQTTYDVMPSGFEATCPSGTTAVGTGFNGDGVNTITYLESYGSFVGGFLVNDSSVSATAQLYAVCAPGSSGLAPSVRSDDSAQARYQADLTRIQANAR